MPRFHEVMLRIALFWGFRLATGLLVALLVATGFAALEHDCGHADHASSCALCALLFSPAAPTIAGTLAGPTPVAPAAAIPVLREVPAPQPSPFDSRAPPAV